ncbi:MAPEG family protein [uncultured Sphingomonas sp.]|nr:MAPEG family protein [uncultured Sphingomonas sp.]
MRMLLTMLGPAIGLVALTFVMAFVLLSARLRHMKAHPPRREDFASGEAAARYFSAVALPADNVRNLFEMPVLFYALVPLLLFTGHGGIAQVLLGWIYVVLRALHSHAHVTGATVRRFRLFLMSMAVLLAMWIGFAIDLLLSQP